jgi:hypothetical protein
MKNNNLLLPTVVELLTSAALQWDIFIPLDGYLAAELLLKSADR